MADNESDEKKDDEGGHRIERWVGIAVVVLATFLGVCNVKEIKSAREAMAAKYLENADTQAKKMKQQKEDAEEAERKYMQLNNKNDQFDLSEASLAVALTMMGVTALIKRWWMFWMAMIPAAFALFMGAAGFAGVDTNNPVIRSIIQVLS